MIGKDEPLPSGSAPVVVASSRAMGRGRTFLTDAGWAALVAVGCYAAARLGFSLAGARSSVGLVWPASGVALAAVLLGGYRMLPAVALGDLLAGLSTRTPLAAVAGIAIGLTLEALVGAALLRQASFQSRLRRTRDVAALIALAGVLSTTLSATIGVLSLLGAGALPSAHIAVAWRSWWLASMCGDLLAASPVLVLAGAWRPAALRRPVAFKILGADLRGRADELAIGALLIAASIVGLGSNGAAAYVIFPVLLLAALRLCQRGAVTGGLIVSAVAIWYTSRGHGPFASAAPQDNRLQTQIFLAAAAITALLAAAARSERRVSDTMTRSFGPGSLGTTAVAADAFAYQARHDSLTGLPNRMLLFDRLEHALARAQRSKSRLAVLFLDLDDFKVVNDTFGHDAGDLLLVALTPQLSSALRPGDTVARFGGDEFVVLCEELEQEADAIQIAQRITEACGRPLRIGQREHTITLSAGVVIVEAGAAEAKAVLREADAAMYRAKASGSGRVEIFDELMRARLAQRSAIEDELGAVLARQELRLLYQPIFSLTENRLVGVEALLRWQHPERGLLEPAEFLRVAESCGLIVPIGEWVLAQACRQAAAWRALRPHAEPIRMSVNLSPSQVARAEIAETVRRTLDSTGLEPSLLALEITEATLLEDGKPSVRALRDLSALGIRLVLDDFGTGYSSLSYLKRFTIDAVKIDRSIVAGLEQDGEDVALIAAVLGVARALVVDVIAEGVETVPQLSHLRAHRCGFAQGYLFAAPLPAEELETLLGAGTDRRALAI